MSRDKVSSKFWNDFPGCVCLKSILINFGFDSIPSLKGISDEKITELEKKVEKNRSIIEGIACEHAKSYNKSTKFEFLPGHRSLLLDWCQNDLHKVEENRTFTTENAAFSPLLREIINSALFNHNISKNGHRFSEAIMDFSIYLYVMAGKACYEMLCANLPLPKSGTVVNKILEKKERIIEGELRCKQLSQYLQNSNAPKSVFLSEDASGILKKVVYDSESDQMVGLVLPISKENGMPQTLNFVAETAEKMEEHLKEPLSTLVYIVVAQPLKENTPPFILQIYGTDNKFDKDDVAKRWNHTVEELKKFGITVIGISSDGDNRLVSVMRTLNSFDLNEIMTTEPKMMLNSRLNCIQDIIHIATKFRNRILNSSIVLYIGNKVVSVIHIKSLLKLVSKEVHGLVYSDIIPEDRQNYHSLEKIMDNRVLNAMKMHVVDCEGTIMYLKLCRLITSSFTEPKLKPIERIYNIWHAVFFLRCWRKHIKSSAGYTLANNFISNNSYTCVEINAHNLIAIVRTLRSTGQQSLFLTQLFASQPCEHIFRMMRSMGTINYTKINFWLNELLHMISKVDLMNKIIYTRNEFDFPRTSKDGSSNDLPSLPTDDEIKQTIRNAQINALKDAAQFGIFFVANDIKKCNLKQVNPRSAKTNQNESKSDDHTEDEDGKNSDLDSDDLGDDETKEIVGENTSEEETSPFLIIMNPDGTTRKVRKSTFIWERIEERDKLSSDRLRRVQGSSHRVIGSDTKYKAKRQKKSSKEEDPEEDDPILDPILMKSNEIMIGDWVIFDLRKETIPLDLKDKIANQKGHLIGLVIGFRIKDGKRSIQYKTNFVSLLNESQDQSEERKNIIILAIWYSCNEDGSLDQITRNLSVGIGGYKRTMKSPVIKNEKGSISYILPFRISKLKKLHMISN